MSLEDVKKRFVQEIKLRAFDDRYVDKDEEMEILKIAVADGISVDSARAALRQVCETNDGEIGANSIPVCRQFCQPKALPGVCPLAYPEPLECNPGERLEDHFDRNGCFVGYDCVKIS